MKNLPTFTKTRVAVLAGALGAAGALSMVAASASPDDAPTTIEQARATQSSDDNAPGDISGNCDEAEHANDAACQGVDVPTTPTTAPTTTPTTAAPGGGGGSTAGGHTLRTPGGAVTYRSSGGTLTLLAATPNAQWRVEVEQSSGREIELDFRYGTKRVQVNVEIEDGAVRERVRLRDSANGTDVGTENGVVVRDDSATADDNSGSGTSGSGISGSGSTDDNSGSGSGSSGSGSSGSGSGSGSGGVDDG
jgi:hypothetical protein